MKVIGRVLLRVLNQITSLFGGRRSETNRRGPVRQLDQEAWLQTADLTYCSSRLLFVQGNPYLQIDAGYLLHQAIEKYAKTLIAYRGQASWGHDLTILFRRIMALYREIDDAEVRRLVEKLDHLQELRYADTPFRGGELGPEDLLAGDLVVRLVRERLPKSITDKGIRST